MTPRRQASLAALVETAGDAGDLDSAVRDGREQVSALQAAAERENAAMNHWDGTVEELERLKVPSDATIAAVREAVHDARARRRATRRTGRRALEQSAGTRRRGHDGSRRARPRRCEARSQRHDGFATTR